MKGVAWGKVVLELFIDCSASSPSLSSTTVLNFLNLPAFLFSLIQIWLLLSCDV